MQSTTLAVEGIEHHEHILLVVVRVARTRTSAWGSGWLELLPEAQNAPDLELIMVSIL